MDITQADLKIAPKDCMVAGIPKLPCDNGDTKTLTGYPSLAMAYVPMQKFNDLYKEDYGFQIGTIFKELDLPFLGIGGTLV
jgi:hypothetical protein